MYLKRETEYAILGLKTLSEHPKKFVDIRAVSKENHISYVLLAKTFQKLAKAGLVESKFGPNGGFRILKKAKDMNLFEITSTIQDLRVIECFQGSAPHCKRKNKCTMRIVIEGLQDAINKYLENIKLESVS